MSKFAQFFQEDNGNLSATRLAFLAWIFGVLLIWCNVSVQNKKMEEIPSGVQVLIGVLMTGKVAQKFREEQSNSTSEEIAPVAQQPQLLNGNAAVSIPPASVSAIAAQDR